MRGRSNVFAVVVMASSMITGNRPARVPSNQVMANKTNTPKGVCSLCDRQRDRSEMFALFALFAYAIHA